MSITPKKTNLFKFFKSEDFQDARRKMCAMYILLTEVNEMHEDIDDLLKGYDGLFIGDLKHAAKEATAALERYSNLYLSNIGGDGLDLCEATATMTKGIDVAMEQSKFFLQEAHKAIHAAVKAGEDKHLDDAKQLAKEAADDFEICDSASHLTKTMVSSNLGFRVRRLTERELFRLMDVSEKDIDTIQAAGISKTQQAKMAGNSIVVACMYEIFNRLFIATEPTELTLF